MYIFHYLTHLLFLFFSWAMWSSYCFHPCLCTYLEIMHALWILEFMCSGSYWW